MPVDQNLILGYLGSAGLAVLVSKIFDVINSSRERKSRREEAAIKPAAELTQQERSIKLEIAKADPTRGITFLPPVMTAAQYYTLILETLEAGKLPEHRPRRSKRRGKSTS